MTGGEIVILMGVITAIWAQWRSDRAADLQHRELVDRLAGLEHKLEGDLQAMSRVIAADRH